MHCCYWCSDDCSQTSEQPELDHPLPPTRCIPSHDSCQPRRSGQGHVQAVSGIHQRGPYGPKALRQLIHCLPHPLPHMSLGGVFGRWKRTGGQTDGRVKPEPQVCAHSQGAHDLLAAGERERMPRGSPPCRMLPWGRGRYRSKAGWSMMCWWKP